MKLLRIVIPCFNELESLPLLIQNLKNLNSSINFLIVNNGSTDGTRGYLEKISNELENNIEILHLSVNKGYGDGVYRGLKQSDKYQYIGWIHGDLQFEFSKLNNIFDDLRIDSEDKIFYKGLREGRPILDRIFSSLMGLFASIVLNKKMREINAQPTIFSSKLFEKVIKPPNDFSFDTYIYWLALENNYKVIRKQILFPPRVYGESKWNINLKSRLVFSLSLIKYFLELKKGNPND